ncbi:haloalkane dehalogenase [Cupriavidus necator]
MQTQAIPSISAAEPHPRHDLAVAGTVIRYVDTGPAHGDPVVFLHGNPTSSYLWRSIIPHVDDIGRCLAPDLAGMGQSGPVPDGACRFADHARYLDAWFDAVVPQGRITLVLHDWGSALGFDWARRHPQRVRAIVYMEALVQPRRWSDFPPARAQIFRALRGADGERLVMEDNFFVETVLPRSILRPLTGAEMAVYRAPFTQPEARRQTLVWARELPIDGEPADVAEAVAAYGEWLAASNVPKLLVRAEPGALLTGRALAYCRSWPNQQEVTVRGIHYLQEDAPHEIGVALRAFLLGLAGEGDAALRTDAACSA